MSIILDVAIGLVFLYLLLALVATTLQELLATALRLRAKNLYDALAGMLKGNIGSANGRPLIAAFYEHPLIRNLCQSPPKFTEGGQLVSSRALPSYIPSKTFALALLDVLRGEQQLSSALGARAVLANASASIQRIANNPDLKHTLQLLVEQADSQAEELDAAAARISARVEGLFNDRMARASGWYKRQAQQLALVIAAGVTLATNADTLHVADRLWNDAPLRNAIVASAEAYHQAQQNEAAAPAAGLTTAIGMLQPAPAGAAASAPAAEPPATGAEVAAAAGAVHGKVAELRKAGFPIGWPLQAGRNPLLTAAGWLITALAVSLGSNFWFDLLSRALQLRGGGPRVSAVTGQVAPNARG